MFYYQKLKEIRKSKKLSQKQLGELIGKTSKTVYRWEIGVNEPSEYCIRLIADVLNISVSVISDLKDEQKMLPYFYEKLDALDKSTYDISAKTDSEKLDLFFNLQNKLELLLWENNYFKTLANHNLEILQSLKLIVYEKDIFHRYSFVNKYFLSYFNIPDEKLVLGLRNSDIWKNSKAWNELTDLETIVFKSGEQVLQHKIEIPKPLGANGKGFVSISPIKDAEGKISKIACYIIDVTGDEVLREKFFYMESVLDKLEHVVWIIKPKPFRHYLYISKAVHSIYGIWASDFYKNVEKWQDFILDKDRKKVLSELNAGASELTYRVQTYDYKVKWIQHFIYSAEINTKGFEFGVIKDITELKKAKEIQEMLQINIEAMTDGLFVAEADSGDYIFINGAISKTYGYPVEAFYEGGREFWRKKCLHPDFLNEHARKVPSSDNVQKYQFKIVRSNGEVRWIDSTVNTRNVYGKNCFISIEKDITEQKSKEASLSLFEKSIEFMDKGVVICNEKRRILFINKSLQAILGVSLSKIKERKISDFIKSDVFSLLENRNIVKTTLNTEGEKKRGIIITKLRSDITLSNYFALIIELIV